MRLDVPTETMSGGKNEKWPENEATVERTYRAGRTQPDRPDTSGKTNGRTETDQKTMDHIIGTNGMKTTIKRVPNHQQPDNGRDKDRLTSRQPGGMD